MFLTRIVTRLKSTMYAVLLLTSFFHYFLVRKGGPKSRSSSVPERRNILIVGSRLYNKGSQSMLQVTLNELKSRYPDRKIYVLSTPDYLRDDVTPDVNIIPWDINIKASLSGFLGRLFFHHKTNYHYSDNIAAVIEQSEFIIDISGAALSSYSGFIRSLDYLTDILTAKKFGLKYFIYPQSIGPFDYSLPHRLLLFPLLKMALSYPVKIYIREEESYKNVEKYTRDNLETSPDIVLLENNPEPVPDYNLEIDAISIPDNSAGLIPNVKLLNHVTESDLYSTYYDLVQTLLDRQKTVFIYRYSSEDVDICRGIKDLFPGDKHVVLLEEEFDAIQVAHLVKRFDFIVSSRYHSIIHAYKNGVPALVISWAVKYFELLKIIGQLDYFIDCSSGLDQDLVGRKLEKIMSEYENESRMIVDKVADLSNEYLDRIFDLRVAMGVHS